MADLMNQGPDCYKKMLFACLSLNNLGRICEHDIFMLLELFKLKSFVALFNNYLVRCKYFWGNNWDFD